MRELPDLAALRVEAFAKGRIALGGATAEGGKRMLEILDLYWEERRELSLVRTEIERLANEPGGSGA